MICPRPFILCQRKRNVPKSLETKNMEKQGDLEIATFAGGCFGVWYFTA
jgi:hypothetical protein